MASLVEGEWKNFRFRMAEPTFYPCILEHLHTCVYQDEPLNRIAGDSEVKANELDNLAIQYMEENLSFFAIETNSNKVAGVRIIREMSKDAVSPNMSLIQSPELQKMIPFILHLQEEGKVFDTLGVDEIATLVSVSVEREFRRQGLATEMYRRSLAMLKTKGYVAVEGYFSSPFARKIATKMGFQQLAISYIGQYENADGELVFQDAKPDDYVSLMALKL
ncbi:unnamed protein product [Orchesella dallaii]|uniref:N-acetyltransferase domain-containing protein n=1 Tax=Orchesella dallaii TaxID=48710 RepID=A0ABP1PT77_9HEXA